MKNKFKTFYKVGNNEYSIMTFDNDLFIGTKSVLEIPRRWFFKKKINQGFKLLEMTAPISFLFDAINSMEVEKEDKEFPDMTTYKGIDNKKLRKDIKNMYDEVLENEIDSILKDFNAWCNRFKEENGAILPEDQIQKTIAANKQALNAEIEQIRAYSKANSLIFMNPRITDSKDLYNFLQLERMNFLYAQRAGSSLRFNYFYDLDDFGVVTIYKVQTVRGYIKSIETFIYNRDILSKLVQFMTKNNL